MKDAEFKLLAERAAKSGPSPLPEFGRDATPGRLPLAELEGEVSVYAEDRTSVNDFFRPWPRIVVEINDDTTTSDLRAAIPTILAWRNALFELQGPRIFGPIGRWELYLEYLSELQRGGLTYTAVAARVNARVEELLPATRKRVFLTLRRSAGEASGRDRWLCRLCRSEVCGRA
ncbi:MAG: hypothetical protein ABR961_12205, partial [Thermoanaerobaculaceae bacterium]